MPLLREYSRAASDRGRPLHVAAAGKDERSAWERGTEGKSVAGVRSWDENGRKTGTDSSRRPRHPGPRHSKLHPVKRRQNHRTGTGNQMPSRSSGLGKAPPDEPRCTDRRSKRQALRGSPHGGRVERPPKSGKWKPEKRSAAAVRSFEHKKNRLIQFHAGSDRRATCRCASEVVSDSLQTSGEVNGIDDRASEEGSVADVEDHLWRDRSRRPRSEWCDGPHSLEASNRCCSRRECPPP